MNGYLTLQQMKTEAIICAFYNDMIDMQVSNQPFYSDSESMESWHNILKSDYVYELWPQFHPIESLSACTSYQHENNM